MMMTVSITVDVESYRVHAEEQGGTPQSVAALLRCDLVEAVMNANYEAMAQGILAGDDVAILLEVRDGYVDLAEFEEASEAACGTGDGE